MSPSLFKKIRERKGREWWIVRSSDKDISADGFIYVRNPYHSLQIHVVEASRLKVLEDALCCAVEALEACYEKDTFVSGTCVEALQKIEAILGEK